MKFAALLCSSLLALASLPAAGQQATELKDAAVAGGLQDGKMRLVIEGVPGVNAASEKPVFSTVLEHAIQVTRDKVTHRIAATFEIVQGEPKEIPLAIGGEGEVREVTGEALLDWSVRKEPGGGRTLILRPKKGEARLERLAVAVVAERELRGWKNPLPSFTLTPPQAAMFRGFVKIEPSPDLDAQPEGMTGLLPVETKYLPPALLGEPKPDAPEPLAFQFQGTPYTLPLRIAPADPESRRVVLRDTKLVGQLTEQTAAFTLTASARVANPKGGSLRILSGGVALTELAQGDGWRVVSSGGGYVLVFERAGEFPLQLRFNAAVKAGNGWNSVDFRVAPSALQPIVLQGLAADTQFQFAGAARPERAGNDFTSFLPPDGTVKLSWKNAAREAEGKLFYAAEMLSQISIGPGLMRQTALLECKVMQGELDRLSVVLRGAGEVTRVQGAQVLAWNVEPGADANQRKLVVKFNQPQKQTFALQIQTQTPVGAFPQTVDAMQLRPEGATRFAGYFRIVNEGAVRLEVVQATGLSQVSPEQFPESGATKAAFRDGGGQRFAFRFSSVDFSLRIQADQILPELTVSQVLAYHLGENEQTVDAEIELDVREAPLRELILKVPKGYAVARLNAAGLGDYFVSEPAGQPDSELRLVYAQPVSGRQVIQLRLERNQALGAPSWALPRIDVTKAKSVRGHVAVAADAGFRLTPERTQGLTDTATAFFPRSVPGIQAAFRMSDPAWQASMLVERLPQSIQADAFHLFSIGEGVAYGSSVLNYVISGAPVSAFKVEISDEYFNVEFTGKDIRNWQKTDAGYVVQVHTPVSGPYTLLATYERPFKPQGETLAFTGARPLDAKSEQGHTLVISAYQFQVKPVEVSPSLLQLETGEVPAEYRLFFDAPILAAYRYAARPFDLKLALSPLAQGDSLSQVVDRATITTRISKEGQVLTDAQYFVKSRGNAHFRIALAEGTQLWSATVNGQPVVPVKDASANLIPLPQQADPNAVLAIQLKLASRSKSATRVETAAPIVDAPVMLAEWKMIPDAGQKLIYRGGSLTPVGGVADVSGFTQLGRAFSGRSARAAWFSVAAAVVLLAVCIFAWRSGTASGVHRFSARHIVSAVVGVAAFASVGIATLNLAGLAYRERDYPYRDIAFLAPVQQPGTGMTVEVGNVDAKPSKVAAVFAAWPAIFALAAFAYAWLSQRRFWQAIGWTLLAWAALRSQNGAVAFLVLVGAMLTWYIAWPALRRWWSVPRAPKPNPAPASPPPSGGASAAASAAALVMALLIPHGFAQEASPVLPKSAPLAETVSQQVHVEEKFAIATATVRWKAEKGERLPLVYEPAVVTRVDFPAASLKLVQWTADGRRAQHLLALEAGTFEIALQYQVPVVAKDGETGFTLPTQFGVVNKLALTVAGLDVDVVSPQAVSIDRKTAGKDTAAALVLLPANDNWIAWKPRSRDVAREKPVFYVEFTQLYAPTAGIVEGLHHAAIRPAQGELAELAFSVPKGATVTDVQDPATFAAEKDKPRPSIVSQWRFDPDTGKLRVNLAPAQSRPFTLLIRSQIATGPLPISQAAGLISADGAAGQIGLLGVATGNEVQLDNVAAGALSPINLEDFPASLAPLLHAQIPALTVRRAFRYSDSKSMVTLAASAVEPDIRVESQDTLSLGEDRVLLASNATFEITRAGIFRVSFALPAGMDVESIAGETLSHWTELKTETARVITMHLKGRTEGQQKFAITLAGPGVKAGKAWVAPQILFREASKQRGTFLVVPEQGMRLQVAAREGVTQLDPQKSGIKQKGVLAFRILQTPWNLSLDLEQVDAWVQVTSLQHHLVAEAQTKVTANLQYQIENTGLKSLKVTLPKNAENVRFTGDEVADFLAQPHDNEELQTWEIKLHRRMIGAYFLQATYQVPVPAGADSARLRGAIAEDVNLQRGFVTIEASGRLQVRAEAPPTALQPIEWQSIPRALQKDLTASSASFAFRLVEPAFDLPVKLERHEAAKLLPARVSKITLTSIVSDSGAMLTQVHIDMLPGDKRLLHLTMPKDAKFWFAFVNKNAVWPWKEADQILIPLEQQSRTGGSIPVEIFFSSQVGDAGKRDLDLQLQAPKFDLPLEDITWQVYLDDKWELEDWRGALQLQSQRTVARGGAVNVQTYLQKQKVQLQEKTKAAEEMLAFGNRALATGETQQARRAFESAWSLSQHDMAFNEDARVQLHNLKLQQAIVGLNVRQSQAAGEPEAVAGKLKTTRDNKEANYSQSDAKQIVDRNSPEENAAFNKLAERIIQQQDAAVSTPAGIQANIPEQGRLLTFHRAVLVETWANLDVTIEAEAARPASWFMRFMLLILTVLAIWICIRIGSRSFRLARAS